MNKTVVMRCRLLVQSDSYVSLDMAQDIYSFKVQAKSPASLLEQNK